jgi:hypothetical protein
MRMSKKKREKNNNNRISILTPMANHKHFNRIFMFPVKIEMIGGERGRIIKD